MKTHHLFSVLILLLAVSGCIKDQCEQTRRFINLTPIYKTGDEFRTKSVDALAPRELRNPGKIYFFKQYIFINEVREGLHVIDNQDPSNPQNVAFYAIPGNVDIAARNEVLLVDSYVDLLSINIKNVQQPSLVQRVPEVFDLHGKRNDGAYLVDYAINEVEEISECQLPPNTGVWFERGVDILVDVSVPTNQSSGAKVLQSAGIAGSQSRFTQYAQYLYAVNDQQLKVFDVAVPTSPELINELWIGWGIETIFPYQDKLFIGSQTGMSIFDNSNPSLPVHTGTFQHANACDPVFVDGDLAYVTLRDGTTCETFTNQLDIVNVSDIYNPYLITSYPMHNPHGLSILDKKLYLCEGDEGLKVFDVSDTHKIDKNQLDHVKGLHAYDVITLNNNVALVIGKDGFYQYDISNPKSVKEISRIPVTRI